MPYFTLPNGHRLYYEIDGPNGAEPLVFAHGLLWSGRMFEQQVAYFRNRYRVVTFDHRGQGRSDAPPGDGYDMETVYQDAVAFIEGLGLGPVHFAGLSMGGFVGMRLAARRPELLRSLILLETSADPEPAENHPKYRLLNNVVKWVGFWPVVPSVMKIMFGRAFLTDPARADERRRWRHELRQNNRRSITRAVEGVITRRGVADELSRIGTPTLVIVGDQDVATVPDKARRIQAGIAGAQLVIIPNAGHSASIEEPVAVNQAIDAFLNRTTA